MLKESSCTFHHLGVACHDLDDEAEPWLRMGYKPEGPDFEDPIQRVRGRFIVGTGPRLELLVATTKDSPITRMLARGIKYYHQAFTVSSFDKAVVEMKLLRCKMIVAPVSAAAFGGARIAFFLMPNMNMVELIEEQPPTLR